MERYMKRLPTEVVDKIFTYYYSPQSEDLLEDIKNYNKTLKAIKKIYYDFWINNWPVPFKPAPNQDKYWLINDIISFSNQKRESANLQKSLQNLKSKI